MRAVTFTFPNYNCASFDHIFYAGYMPTPAYLRVEFMHPSLTSSFLFSNNILRKLTANTHTHTHTHILCEIRFSHEGIEHSIRRGYDAV